MRKFVSMLICLLLLLGLAIPTFAAGVSVTFTDDSLPEAGGTLTVDTNALMNNGSITSEMYNALLETAVGEHVHFSVSRNDEPMDPVEFLNLG